ncbi:MAG TPA: DUF1653 domain-containing protein [Candidatus Paceibacterota bacterium]|nr:DUF1653 domain-containing protein [Candidatus Paceibacterota bacterium]
MKAIPGKRYRHYKGGEYTVLAVGRMETSPDEEYVVYRMEYDTNDLPKGTVWLRARAVFEERTVVDGVEVERFTELA